MHPSWRTRGRALFSTICLLGSLLFINIGCGTLPRDPERTSERVGQEHQVRVGLVENPPWVIRPAGEPAGVEVELARQFAASLGSKPKWFWGSEQHHMEALEHFELDLVLCGLNATTPWSKRVGLTRPYFEEEFTVGVPSGTPPPDTLRGLKVAAQEADVTAAYVQRKGAIPLRVEDTSYVNGPLAAPAWLLEQKGLTRTKFVLFEKKHVMAVPPGENGWLALLGNYLQGQRSSVPTLLTREVQP